MDAEAGRTDPDPVAEGGRLRGWKPSPVFGTWVLCFGTEPEASEGAGRLFTPELATSFALPVGVKVDCFSSKSCLLRDSLVRDVGVTIPEPVVICCFG